MIPEEENVVIMAYVLGGIAVLIPTLLRYLLASLKTPSSTIPRRMLDAIKLIDLRQNSSEARITIGQYMGIAYLLAGAAYQLILTRWEIDGEIKHILFAVLCLIGPGAFFALLLSWLKKEYWK